MLQPPNYQADASTYLSNRQALRALEQEDKLLSTVYYGCSSLLAAGTVFFSPSGILALPPMWLLLRRTHKLNQIHRNMTALLDTFEDQGVELIPRLTIPGQGSLDLFARFPSKHLFAIALRSQGKSTIFYNEAEEALKIRRQQGGRGLNLWTPDHVQRLSDQEFWLRRNQSDLFGKSSRDKRRPLGETASIDWTNPIREAFRAFICNDGQSKGFVTSQTSQCLCSGGGAANRFCQGLVSPTAAIMPKRQASRFRQRDVQKKWNRGRFKKA